MPNRMDNELKKTFNNRLDRYAFANDSILMKLFMIYPLLKFK